LKIVSKIWEWLTLFFAGIIAGIWIFIKFLDTPENQIHIDKVKQKNSSGSITVDVQQEQQNRDEIIKKRFKRKSK